MTLTEFPTVELILAYPALILLSLILFFTVVNVVKEFFNPYPIPMVPSYVPFVGSIISYIRDPIGFIDRHSSKFQTGIFGFRSIGGTRCVVVTDTLASHSVINGKFPYISWRRVKFRMLTHLAGMRTEAAEAILEENQRLHVLLDRHLINSDSLESITAAYQDSLNDRVLPSLLPAAAGDDATGWFPVSVFDFFLAGMFMSTAEVLYGDADFASYENFRRMMRYDEGFSGLVALPRRLSRLAAPDAHAAREELGRRMARTLSSRAEGLSDPVRGFEAYDAGRRPKPLTLDDRARHQLTLLHAALINTAPTLFWVVYRLLCLPDAYAAVADEARSVAGSDPGRRFGGEELDGMTGLDSLISEVLRLQTSHASIRNRVATKPFVMKLTVKGQRYDVPIKRGDKIFTCATAVHRDPDVFEDPLTFRWDRFCPNEDGSARSFYKGGVKIRSPVVAFGGGATYCPGRKFARNQIKSWVARVLAEYDMRFSGGTVPARAPEMATMWWGQSQGMPETDVEIEFRRRRMS